MTGFVQKFTERKIGQTAAVYIGTGWVLVEAVGSLSQRYEWPSFLYDQMIVLALCGLPIVLMMKWNQNSSEPIPKKRLVIFYSVDLIILALASYLVFQHEPNVESKVKHPTYTKSVAVLPFSNLSKDPEQEYFGEGIMEDIISKLYKIADLQVTSRTSSLMYKQTTKSIQQIAGELGVTYVVEGSVRKSGNKVRVTARLIKAENDQNVWTETYDKSIEDIFLVQNELSGKIANGLKATITASELERINKIPTANTQAYEFYQQGRYYLTKPGKESIQLSKTWFNRAIQADPDFALAYVGLAESYISNLDWGYASAAQKGDSIQEALMMALKLDDSLGEAYASLGAYHLFVTHNFKESRSAFERSLQLNPGYDFAYYHYATLCASESEFVRSIELIERGIMINPLSAKFQGYKAQFYMMARDPQTAYKEIKRIQVLFPDDDFILWTMACTVSQLGQYDLAVENFLSRKIESRETNWMLGYTYAKKGEKEKAKKVLDFLIEKNKTIYVPSTFIGLLYSSLGDLDHAMDYLEKGFEEGDTWIIFAKVHPMFDPLRNHPRFKDMIKKFDNPESI